MLAPAKHRFNVTEYYRLAETGILPPGARVELLDGEIIDMSPIGPFPGGVTNFLTKLFVMAARDRWEVSVQNPVRLSNRSEPQPDLMLLKPTPDGYRKRLPQPDDVFLLVEVSDTTLALDLSEKLPVYGRAGIAEVWIVNLNEETVEVYHDPHFTGYASKTVFHAGEQVPALAFPDLTVSVTELFQR